MTFQDKLHVFDQRLLDRHAGPIISDLSVAIVQFVSNAWDAYATIVDITWPTADVELDPTSVVDARGYAAPKGSLLRAADFLAIKAELPNGYGGTRAALPLVVGLPPCTERESACSGTSHFRLPTIVGGDRW